MITVRPKRVDGKPPTRKSQSAAPVSLLPFRRPPSVLCCFDRPYRNRIFCCVALWKGCFCHALRLAYMKKDSRICEQGNILSSLYPTALKYHG